jgi:hypothetical protein
MTREDAAVLAAVVLSVVGMMLVVGGVLVTGLFLPGVVLIGMGLLVFVLAAVLHGMATRREPGAPPRGA